MQEDLSEYVNKISAALKNRGQNISHAKINGYLLLYLNKKIKTNNPQNLESILGDTSSIANKLITRLNVDWPVNPWYGDEIAFSSTIVVKAQMSSRMANIITMFHLILLIPAIIFILLQLLFLAAFLSLNDDVMLSEMADPMILRFYSFFACTVFPLTIVLIRNENIRRGIRDLEEWLAKIRKISVFHFLTYYCYTTYLLLGSFLQLDDIYTTGMYNSINGIYWPDMVESIFLSSVIFYIGMKTLWSENIIYGIIKNIPPRDLIFITITWIIKGLLVLNFTYIIHHWNHLQLLFYYNTYQGDYYAPIQTMLLFQVIINLFAVLSSHRLPPNTQSYKWKSQLISYNSYFILFSAFYQIPSFVIMFIYPAVFIASSTESMLRLFILLLLSQTALLFFTRVLFRTSDRQF